MLRFICLFVLVSMLSPFVAGAGAQQTGGLPDVAARVTTLETLVATLQTNVTTLQTNVTTLQTNVTALQAANSGLQNALTAEVAARMAADTTLQNAINTEAGARQAADANLTTAINNESTARASGDTGLQNQLNAIQSKPVYYDRKGNSIMPNGDMTVILESQLLPIGSYLVHFTATAWIDSVFGDEGAQCNIESPAGAIWTQGYVAVHLFNGTVSLSTFVYIGNVGGGHIQVVCGASDYPARIINAELFSIPIPNLKTVSH